MSIQALIAVISDELYERAAQVAADYHAHAVTFVPARGIDFPEHLTFFGQTFQGANWVMIALLDGDCAQAVEEALNRELQLEQRFAGLVFTLEIDRIPESLIQLERHN